MASDCIQDLLLAMSFEEMSCKALFLMPWSGGLTYTTYNVATMALLITKRSFQPAHRDFAAAAVEESARVKRLFSCLHWEWGLCEYVIVHTILGGSSDILWISLGGKPKWLPLKFGYHDVMSTSPIVLEQQLKKPLLSLFYIDTGGAKNLKLVGKQEFSMDLLSISDVRSPKTKSFSTPV